MAHGTRVTRIAGLPERSSHALVAAGRPVRLARGDVIFRQGDPGDAVFLVVCGRVRIGRPGDAGRERMLILLGPGDLFGELTLFDPAPRKATASAVTDVELLAVPAEVLRRWLVSEPDAPWQWLRFLAQRLRRTTDVVENLLYADVPRRVTRTLLALADRFGRPVPGGVRVDHGLTQDELARYVGASRESVNRILAELAGRAIIQLEPRALVISDLTRLRRKASSDSVH